MIVATLLVALAVAGGANAAVIRGGPAAQRFVGNTNQADKILAGKGNDVVFAQDKRPDYVNCGPGEDRAVLDRSDRTVGCEHRVYVPHTRTVYPPPGPTVSIGKRGSGKRRWVTPILITPGATGPPAPAAPAAPAPRAALRTFYVSSGGNDGASGSLGQAWKTIGKVNRAALRPGDAILFEGGATFGDAQLDPRVSGTSRDRIWYGSYGTGRATISKGVHLDGLSWLTFQGLQIQGSADAIVSGGSGNAKIEILDNLISAPGIGVNSWLTSDADWLIAGNTISHTGDSGIVIHGPRNRIAGNTITDTGAAISYGAHGIYIEAPDAVITGNTIDGFADQGVSTRFRNAQIRDNVIRNGRNSGNAGIAYFPDDPTAGSTLICGNTISAVRYAVLIGDTGRADQYGEHFDVRGNSLSSTAGSPVYVPSGRPFSITQSGNVTSTSGMALASAAPCGV
jgi:putative cofactor-binding repeat protein/parallel beta-helix repeat protein